MKIDIISDTVCPWCFVGKRRLERALARRPGLDAEIAWHPFQLNPDMPLEGMDRALYLQIKFGDAERAREVYRSVAEAASSEALTVDLARIGRTPNTLNSHRLIHYSGRVARQEQIVEALFRAYFELGADIGDIATLTRIAAEAGLDAYEVAAYLGGDEDVDLIRASDRHARAMGIGGVPCFIVDGKYAVSGAQDPEVFLQVFAVAEQNEAGAKVPTAAE